MNYGATILDIVLRVKETQINVVTAPKDPESFFLPEYREKGKYFGASVGPFAGRISPVKVNINGTDYVLSGSEGIHLHGGEKALSYQFWDVEETIKGPTPSVVFSVRRPDGEGGYPGNVVVRVRYTLTEENEVWIDYFGLSDKDTLLNLTNHTYFNLNGHGDISGHELRVEADQVLKTDENLVPTGDYLNTADTPLDFKVCRPIGKTRLDTIYVFGSNDLEKEKACLFGNETGIELKVYSDQPAVVLYVPEDLPREWRYNTLIGNQRQAICLESQAHPNGPHFPHFPSSVVKAGYPYIHRIRWAFSF